MLRPHLSCTSRGVSTTDCVLERNQANLLLSVYAYQAMHALRRLLEESTDQGWSLQRLREQVLKVASRVTVHARQIRIDLARSAERWWAILNRGLRAVWPYP